MKKSQKHRDTLMQKERPEDYGLFRSVALNAISDTEAITKTAWRDLALSRTPPEYFARRWAEAKTKNYKFTSATAFANWTFAMLAQSFQKTGLITREMPGKLPGTPLRSVDEWVAKLTAKGQKAKSAALRRAANAPVNSECRAVLPIRIGTKKEVSHTVTDLSAIVKRLDALERTMGAIRAAVLSCN